MFNVVVVTNIYPIVLSVVFILRFTLKREVVVKTIRGLQFPCFLEQRAALAQCVFHGPGCWYSLFGVVVVT